jgi:hypothetical protein
LNDAEPILENDVPSKYDESLLALYLLSDELQTAVDHCTEIEGRPLSAQEAIDFISRHAPPPGTPGSQKRRHIVNCFSSLTDGSRIEWTPALYEALVNVAEPAHLTPALALISRAQYAFKMTWEEIAASICSEAALDPKRHPKFDEMKTMDHQTFCELLDSTGKVRRSLPRYLSRAIAKRFAKPSQPS